MPIMDGLELAKEIHSHYPRIVTLIVSGYTDFFYAQKAIDYNVRKYIIKPIKYDELRHTFSGLKSELDNRLPNKLFSKEGHASNDEINVGHYKHLIESICTFIDENFREVTLERAAEKVHLNPSYLSNVFRLTTGEKFSEYLTRVKMKNAAEMLANPELRIQSIASMIGYSNTNNFARAFSAYHGMPPSEYRMRVYYHECDKE
jgi:YesN/AraC family two-component response regulator